MQCKFVYAIHSTIAVRKKRNIGNSSRECSSLLVFFFSHQHIKLDINNNYVERKKKTINK